MLAVQYELPLPADYDMEIIRERVRGRGTVTDTWPDLGFKAYLIRQAGRYGSPVNTYAPFYLWNNTPGFNRFMWDGGFANIVRDFGRPPARQWSGLAFDPGPSINATPQTATRDTWSIPGDLDPAVAIAHAVGETGAVAVSPQVHSTALAIDTRTWELVRFTLWRDEAPADAPGAHFQVLHLSKPGLHEIRAGRHW
ncbi:MAG: DUF4865 family protein [Solirubrobacteraceae bacterium]|nr:DUF4865 family protein [Patulibacter sp.]